eukprot:846042-Pelagomonas_calceolata.AAC.1
MGSQHTVKGNRSTTRSNPLEHTERAAGNKQHSSLAVWAHSTQADPLLKTRINVMVAKPCRGACKSMQRCRQSRANVAK